MTTEEEKKDEKVLLGNIYNDKVAELKRWTFSHPIILSTSIKSGLDQEFLREVYEKCEDSKELQDKSEEGFLFLTDRSKFSWLFQSYNSSVQIRGVANSEASVRDKRGKSCSG